ncbi:MAG: hypothetical protein KAX19_00850, partial [Candidatus Brocadiae bacterium]|nr:hypothetical protein [Candidatus Brocadiia bacterium]
MSISLPRSSRRGLSRLIQAAPLFAFLYLYVWRVIDPALIYHGYWLTGTFPVFWVGRAFREGFLAYPGGPVEYLSAFL